MQNEFREPIAKKNTRLSEVREVRIEDYLDELMMTFQLEDKLRNKKKTMIYQRNLANRMSVTEKAMEKDTSGRFLWAIDKIEERRKNYEYILSEYFYLPMRPYKLALSMRANGIGDVAGTGLTFRMFIYCDIRNDCLNWPFKADVTIRIINEFSPDKCKTISKRCEIERPSNNSYRRSDHFDFLYSDLSSSLLLAGNSFVVECCIDLRN